MLPHIYDKMINYRCKKAAIEPIRLVTAKGEKHVIWDGNNFAVTERMVAFCELGSERLIQINLADIVAIQEFRDVTAQNAPE